MAATESKMIPLGTVAPYFHLKDVISGKWFSLDDFKNGRPLLVMFICNHCPYVKHIIEKLVEVTKEFIQKGVNIVGINPNDYDAYPEDSPEKMKEYATKNGYPFPYLIDETQEVARSYNAACTPDFFLFDSGLKLIYHGQFDDSRPGNSIPVTGSDLKRALECAVSNQPIDFLQKPSIGCSIKWKK
ncbi:MAG: thioredoxin family protein [Candidatus Kapaibacteriota bacterium]|jgi:peroxiredoxin